jgi:hypothetical protein
MKSFEELICDNKLVREAALLPMAQKAYNDPKNGVQILIPAAENVIRDCAMITTKYLPFWVLSHFTNPFTQIKGVDIDCIKDQARRIYDIKEGFNIKPALDPYNDFEVSEDAQKYHTDVYILAKAFNLI